MTQLETFYKDFQDFYKSDKCVACGRSIVDNGYFFSQVYSEDMSRKNNVYLCLSCGLAYVHPFLGIEEEKRIYADYIAHHFSEYMASSQADIQFKLQGVLNDSFGSVLFKSRNIWLKKMVSGFLLQRALVTYPIYSHAGHEPLKVLDIGCGDGYFLDKAKNFGCLCYGTEYNDALIERLRLRGIKASINLENFQKEIKGDLDKFDIIRINWVLEHVIRPRDMLIEARKLLKDNGELIIGVPNFNTPSRVFKEHFQMHIPQHRQLFTKKSLKEMLQGCGFKIVYLRTKSLGILGPTLARKCGLKTVNLGFRLADILCSVFFDLFNIGDCFEVYSKKRGNRC